MSWRKAERIDQAMHEAAGTLTSSAPKLMTHHLFNRLRNGNQKML